MAGKRFEEMAMTSAETSGDIAFTQAGNWGVITLTRAKALNSLTMEMCAAIDQHLAAWEKDDSIKAVLVEGAGEKAFCAGGDIRWLIETGKEDPAAAAKFFRVEYLMNARIAAYTKPYVALMDGICMGGGVGISMSASHRIVTDRTLWAMPECGIGLIPDVGATYMLPRLPGGMGLYLGLTGARLKGPDCVTAEVGTHYVEGDSIDPVRTKLLAADLSGNTKLAIDAVLKENSSGRHGDIIEDLRDIDTYFEEVTSISELLLTLRRADEPFTQKCYSQIRSGSPTSLALTLKSFNEAPATFNECISREFCVAANLMTSNDFHEGVRAQIIDKDRNPTWDPVRHDDVTEEALSKYFETPEGGPLDLSSLKS